MSTAKCGMIKLRKAAETVQNAFPVSFPLAPGSFLRSFSDGGVEQKQARKAHNLEVIGAIPITAITSCHCSFLFAQRHRAKVRCFCVIRRINIC